MHVSLGDRERRGPLGFFASASEASESESDREFVPKASSCSEGTLSAIRNADRSTRDVVYGREWAAERAQRISLFV